ncbi:peptidylprolyl isomerase [Candidatus Woesearchaeota archaeon]|nr:peptidylprolyl isomerase [Candidatus Woesearchaeota archaeon]
MAIKKGDRIKVEYTGSLEDGSVFDSNKGKDPLEFEVGSGQIIKGFDAAVIGMSKGEEKNIKIQSNEAYGEVNLKLIRKVPKEQINIGREIKKGMILGMRLPNRQEIPARVSDISDKEITLDLNHILAGKVLNFKIKILEIL